MSETSIKKRICPAVREIIRALRARSDSNERFIFRMHTTLYHRPNKEFDREVEYCKVFSMTVDPISWEEVTKLAASGEQV